MILNKILHFIFAENTALVYGIITCRMKKNSQKSAILFGTKSNAYLQINRSIFAYSWLFLPIFAYLRICSKSPQIYFAFRAKYPCLFLPIFRHLTCVGTDVTRIDRYFLTSCVNVGKLFLLFTYQFKGSSLILISLNLS